MFLPHFGGRQISLHGSFASYLSEGLKLGTFWSPRPQVPERREWVWWLLNLLQLPAMKGSDSSKAWSSYRFAWARYTWW